MKLYAKLFLLLTLIAITESDPDPNFYIFLAFGQSNMEGQGDIEQEDIDGVTDRFKMMPAIDFPKQKREAHKWYKAEPPLCRQWTHISPLDNFGRTLVENLPEEISVGVINVAVGGCSIDMFDEDKCEDYVKTTENWLQQTAAEYGNHPFKVLMEAAKIAQKSGVIKGILLHQGESNNGEEDWPEKVKLIYERMLKELNLKSEDVPLLVGEVVREEVGGLCFAHNKIIAKIPEVIENGYAISSEGCTSKGDGYHFDAEGNRLLGKRYAEKWLEIKGNKEKKEFDPNFYIFLAFGQSNMEGQGEIEDQDKDGVPDRFKMMPAIDFPYQKREAHKWYKAEPPLCRQWTHISPLDNFGRTLVENLPEEISVGVISVAVGGCSIDMFDEDKCEDYVKTTEDWLKDIAADYDNHPFKVLMEAAKIAQKSGVIKGILLHQGESNNGEEDWPKRVKLIYERMLKELKLKSEDVPLLVGEVVREDQGGLCYDHNKIIAKIPEVIENGYAISSEGCTSKGDGYHFNSAGYRLLGKRYAEKWLEINGYIEKEEFDPNFYIFLAFGQSNMEGQGEIEDQDRENIPDNFKMMAAVDFSTVNRKAGKWYTAEPPLCRDWSRISPLDYFGRTVAEKLNNKKIGVINVAVGGCSIVLFDEDRAESYLETTEDWLKDIAKIYNNNPFRVLVNTAKIAQKSGVIKGILLHQGESDTGDQNWPKNVKLVYDRILEELKLKEKNVPLLVGEVVSNEEGGLCYSHNKIIGTIGDVVKNSFVISSEGCPSKNDGYHFNTEGYRILGKRYGEAMIEYLEKHKET